MYGWIFHSKNKQPPLATVRYFLTSYGIKDDNSVQIVRTDQGGEFAKFNAFKQQIEQAGYTLEVTGADNSGQNGIAERPHNTSKHDEDQFGKFWSWTRILERCSYSQYVCKKSTPTLRLQ